MSNIEIPDWKPHWLAEAVTDICLQALGHTNKTIQCRAGSILRELFWAQNQEGKTKEI